MRFKFFIITILTLTLNILLGAPTVTNVSPLKGSSSGGTTVTITGTGFTSGSPVQVSFGGITDSLFSVLSDTTIIATSPPHAPQTVFVTVKVGSATSSPTSDSQYVYQGNYHGYISNSNSGTVSVIDITNDSVGPTLVVGNNPCAIAITPNGTKAYVANATDNSVSVIDTASNTIIANLIVDLFPDAIAIKPDGTEVYIVNNNSGTVSVIDTASNTVNPTAIAVGSNPCTLAIKPDGSKVYVTDSTSNTLSVINAANHIAIANPSVGVFPDAIAITPNGAKAYIVNDNSGQVSVIDTTTDTVSPISISVGNNPCALAITPNGSKIYVANATSNNVSVINATSNLVTTTSPVGVFPKAIAIRPDGKKAYVVNDNSGNVSVIDTATDAVSPTPITVGNNPFAIAITPDGSKAYVLNATSNSVSVINTTSDSVVAAPAVGVFPFAIAITPDQAPLASFTFQSALAGQPSTFDASSSASPVGSIVDYFWDFGDGQTGNQAAVQHVYAVPGTYSVTLTVTNSAGTSTKQIYDHSSSHDFNFLNLPITRNQAITHNGGPSATRTQLVTISASIAGPVVSSVMPNFGPTGGGTMVTITGMNFINVTAVFFGTTPATSFIVNSSTSITAVSPQHAAGTVDVRVATSQGTSPTTPDDQFTFVAPSLLPLPPTHLKIRQVKNTCSSKKDLINILTWKAPKKGSPPFEYRIYRNRRLTKLAAMIPANKKLKFKDHNRRKGRTYKYFIITVDKLGNTSIPAKIVLKQATKCNEKPRKAKISPIIFKLKGAIHEDLLALKDMVHRDFGSIGNCHRCKCPAIPHLGVCDR